MRAPDLTISTCLPALLFLANAGRRYTTRMPQTSPPQPVHDRPRIPLAPVLSGSSLARSTAARPPSVQDAGALWHVTSGRVAIALALRAMGVGAGHTVLVPAFHSPAMVPPVLLCGATPVFYRIHPDTSVDLDDVEIKLHGARVLMVTHYFGFPQDMTTIRAWCDRRGLLLLEDCAHCWFGQHGARPVGAWGDYAIASSMKFFPIFEGGALISARPQAAAPALRGAGLRFELKATLAALESAFAYGRLGWLDALLSIPLRVHGALRRRHKAHAPQGEPLAPSSSDSSYELEPRWLDKRSSLFSRAVIRLSSKRRICAHRRRAYRRLEQGVQTLPGVRPLHPSLPESVCPWVFPLLAEQPEKLAGALRAAGLPMLRFGAELWPGVDAATCPVALQLGRNVIGLPCHQELRDGEIDAMLAVLRAVA